MYLRNNKVAPAGVLLLGLWAGIPAAAQAIRVGEQFPDFEGEELLSGKRIALRQFRGKVVLIDFWATWCRPCRLTIPSLKKLYQSYHDRGLEIISISLDRSRDDCRRFVRRREMNWHHICDGRYWKARLAQRFGIHAIPQLYLIAKDGKLLAHGVPGPKDLEKLGQDVQRALARPYDGPPAAEQTPADPIERQARAALAEADRLQAQGQYAAALEKYDQIGLRYLGRPAAKLANQRARLIRENPELAKALRQQRPTRLTGQDAVRAARWLKLAGAFARQKNYRLARNYYQQVVDKYPASQAARTARRALKNLPK